MELSAVHHDMDKRYCFAIAKNKFIIRLKTKKDDMKKVILHHRDKYIPLERMDTRQTVEMEKVACDGFCDYYEATVEMDLICLRYFFELIDNDDKVMYYGNQDFRSELIDDIQYMFDCPQTLREEEIFDSPDWAKNKVCYQIFPSRFASSEKVPAKDWYVVPIESSANLKGNLRGIINHLNHLKELGVDIVYLTPIFESDSSHKYDTIDYYKIDHSFGTMADFDELVKKVHKLGMKIVLDGVFNHTAQKFFAFDDIKKNGEKSKYVDWYYIDSFPLKYAWGEKPSFKSFGNHGGMPKINLQNPEASQYFIDVAKYWIKEHDIDGWRLDVGDEISHIFWKRFRKEVRSVKNDVLIIGEVWHYPVDFLEGDEWDGMMNYRFYDAVQNFVAHESFTASKFLDYNDYLRGNLNPSAYAVNWNILGTHDTSRFLFRCSENKSKLKLAAALQMCSPGTAFIYYGDEYGMTGGDDPDCRRGMYWDKEYQDEDIFNWYKTLIKIRKEYPCITTGKTTYKDTDDKNGIIILTKELNNQKVTLIFHGKNEEMNLKGFNGKNILTGNKFNGKLGPYETVILI